MKNRKSDNTGLYLIFLFIGLVIYAAISYGSDEVPPYELACQKYKHGYSCVVKNNTDETLICVYQDDRGRIKEGVIRRNETSPRARFATMPVLIGCHQRNRLKGKYQ